MPQIKPLQYSKLGAAGLISPDATGSVRIGTGTIQTPSAAEPRNRSFVPREAGYGSDVGARVANVAEAMYTAALRREQALGKAKGQEAAMQLYEKYNKTYYGNEKDLIGVVGQSQMAFVQQSHSLLQDYMSEIKQAGQKMPKYMAAKFAEESFNLYKSLETDVRSKQQKETADYLDAVNLANNSAQGFTLARSYSLAKTTAVGAPDYSQFQVQMHNATVSRMQFHGMPLDDEATYMRMSSEVMRDTLLHVYAQDNGFEIGQDLYDAAVKTITDPTILAEIKDLPLRTLETQVKQLDIGIAKQKAEERSAWFANFDSYVRELSQFPEQGMAEGYIKELHIKNPQATAEINTLVGILFENRVPTAASLDLQGKAQTLGWGAASLLLLPSPAA